MNIMGLPELKNKVLMYIENADENQLVKISDIFEKDYTNTETQVSAISEPIIAYHVSGKPLTLKEYNLEIDKGIDDIKNGDFISQENLEIEIQSWYDNE